MRCRLTILLGLLLLCFATAAYADHSKEQSERLDEILRLVQEGVSDDVVVKHIQASGFVFELSSDDILELRGLGVSDAVLEALLDTAIDRNDDYDRDRGAVYAHHSDAYFSLSAGYFSPWYWYPYAWGFYYDPFPVYYSFYYYPFRYGTPWGYYGYCHNYYYRRHWGGYRFDNPRYYVATRYRQGSGLRVARPPLPRGRSGFGMGRGLPGRRADVAPPPRMPPRAQWGDAPRVLRGRFDRSHLHPGSDTQRGRRAGVPAQPPVIRSPWSSGGPRQFAPPAQQPPGLREPAEGFPGLRMRAAPSWRPPAPRGALSAPPPSAGPPRGPVTSPGASGPRQRLRP